LALLCVLLYRKQHFLLGTKSSGVISIYKDRHFRYLPTGDNETSNVKVTGNPLVRLTPMFPNIWLLYFIYLIVSLSLNLCKQANKDV